MILAWSDQVWLAAIGALVTFFGVVNTYLQNRNRTTTETKAKEITEALQENTDVTKETHAIVKEAADN